MWHTIKILLALFPFTLLTSCYTAKPVLRVNPEEKNTTWERGKEFVSYKNGEYEVHTSYEASNDQYLIFDIEVVNNNGADILVAPEQILLYSGNWDNVEQKIIYNQVPERAMDPELQILRMEMAYSQAVANRKNTQIAATALMAAAIPLTIAAAISDGASSDDVDDFVNISNTQMVETGIDIALTATAVNDQAQEVKIISLNDSENIWRESTLRKTTLSAGYSIRGLVFFRKPALDIKKIRIDVPLLNDKISIEFNLVYYFPGQVNNEQVRM